MGTNIEKVVEVLLERIASATAADSALFAQAVGSLVNCYVLLNSTVKE